MNRALLVICFSLLSSVSASAAVFERDWQTSGDGLLTYDDINGREWLDLSVTLLEQFPGTTLEDRYQAVVAELAPGGMFEGFVVSSRTDMTAFAQSAGLNTTTQDFNTNAVATEALIELLGITRTVDSIGLEESSGFINEFSPLHPDLHLEAMLVYVPPRPSSVGGAALLITVSQSHTPSNTGVMLYRVVVPEPRTFAIFLFCLIHISICRRAR